jgi:hypothetical protein
LFRDSEHDLGGNVIPLETSSSFTPFTSESTQRCEFGSDPLHDFKCDSDSRMTRDCIRDCRDVRTTSAETGVANARRCKIEEVGL